MEPGHPSTFLIIKTINGAGADLGHHSTFNDGRLDYIQHSATFILLLVHLLWQLKMEVLYDSRDSVNIVHCKYYGSVILMDPWTMEKCCNFENNGFGNIGIRRTNGDIFGLDVMS